MKGGAPLKRNAELRRGPGPERTRSKPKPATVRRRRNRRAKEFARAYGSLERVRFVQAMPCAVPGCHRRSENAHIETGGTGRKADADKVVNLCEGHHRTYSDSLHNLGSAEAFQRVHAIDLRLVAAAVDRAFPTRPA